MMELVAFLGTDRENWGQISALIKRAKWERIIIVKNKDADDFPIIGNEELIKINSDKPILEIAEELKGKLREKLKREFEVALSIASGNGKEHMALISALLGIPVGIRIVVFTQKGLEFIT